jgi:hypothetical protein
LIGAEPPGGLMPHLILLFAFVLLAFVVTCAMM